MNECRDVEGIGGVEGIGIVIILYGLGCVGCVSVRCSLSTRKQGKHDHRDTTMSESLLNYIS